MAHFENSTIIIGPFHLHLREDGSVEFRTVAATAKTTLTEEQAFDLLTWLQAVHLETTQEEEDFENYASADFLVIDQAQPERNPYPELFPPRRGTRAHPAANIAETLRLIEGVQHPPSPETQDALDAIVEEQRQRLQGSPPATINEIYHPDEALEAWRSAKPLVQAWQREHPYVSVEQEEANRPPTVRFVELRLSEPQWPHLDELLAAIPALHEEYEAPEDAETHQPVKVVSVRYNDLSQAAINLIHDLQLEYAFRDVLVPMADDSEEEA